MCSIKPTIIDCLTILGKLGIQNTCSKKEQVETCNKKVYALLGITQQQQQHLYRHPALQQHDGRTCCTKDNLAQQVRARVVQMLRPIQKNDEKTIIECGVLSVVLLDQLLHHTSLCPSSAALLLQQQQNQSAGEKTAPPGLISVQHRKVVEQVLRVVLYTSVLSCLDEEARLFPKMALVKRKAVIGGRVLELDPPLRHPLLRAIMPIVVSVCTHEFYGIGVRRQLIGEVITACLQLSFAPLHAKRYPDDCSIGRAGLEAVLASVEPTVAVKQLLLLRGIGATMQKSTWLLGVCTSLSVRRYLLREAGDGVRLLVRAGLDLTDGDDWRQCEAVATLVARARVQDVDQFYRIVGPQVARILVSDECKKLGGGVLRVMSIIVSQLMQRSPELSMQYMGRYLLQPLLALTERGGLDAIKALTVGSSVKKTKSKTKAAAAAALRAVDKQLLSDTESNEALAFSSAMGEVNGETGVVLENGSVTDTDSSDASQANIPNGGCSSSRVALFIESGGNVTEMQCSSEGCLNHSIKAVADGSAATAVANVASSTALTTAEEDIAAYHNVLLAMKNCFDEESSTTTTTAGENICNSEEEEEEQEEEEEEDEEEEDEELCVSIWENKCEVERCVTVLYRTVVCGGGGEGCAAVLAPVLCPLLAVAAVPPPCRNRTPATNCIVKHLSNSRNSVAVEKLLALVGLTKHTVTPPLDPAVRLGIGPDGGVKVLSGGMQGSGNNGVSSEETPAMSSHHDLQREKMQQDSLTVDAIVRVLCQIKNPTVVRNFYSALPRYLNFDFSKNVSVNSNLLLTVQDKAEMELREFQMVVMVCELLSSLSEEAELLETVFQSLADAVPMLLSLLKAASQRCHHLDLVPIQEAMLLNVVLLMCHLICGSGQPCNLTASDWLSLQSLLTVLHQLRTKCKNDAIRDFLKQLENTILTRSPVASNCTREAMKQYKENWAAMNATKRRAKKVTIASDSVNNEKNNRTALNDAERKVKTESNITAEVHLSANVSDDSDDSDDDDDDDVLLNYRCSSANGSVYNPMAMPEESDAQLNGNTFVPNSLSRKTDKTTGFVHPVKNQPDSQPKDYEVAMEDLCSPYVAVRGHALLSLTKQLAVRNPTALKNKSKLLALFEHNLKDTDSYIYLMAVDGLATLCEVCPQKAVPVVCSQLCSDRSVADRAKLGEVMTRAARKLGPMLPQYKQHFLNSLLNGVRDQDSMVRATSLSCLGEVCKELRFSIGSFAGEIMSVVANVVQCDECAEPRRAAVLLVTLMLRGLGPDALRVLVDLLRDLYRSLKLIESSDPDDVLRMHAHLAYTEIDTITRNFLVPKMENTKKIYVTQPPPKLF